jgi:hypothetical protein
MDPRRLVEIPCRSVGQLQSVMARCRVDQSIKRIEMSGFAFPLGVYPVDPIVPKSGYTTAFEPADDGSAPTAPDAPDGEDGEGGVGGAGGVGGGGEWEEWPDRYVYDILVPAARVEPLCRSLLSLLPGRIYPILDFLGQDEWREVDPYVSYDLLGIDRFLDTLRRFRGFFFEDGLVGFGAMSEEPFLYVFIDEHKVVTVRVEADLREKVEKVLGAFDLELLDELHSADSVTHEHRSVLEAAADRPDLFIGEEIIEALRDEWRLVLNIDPETNIDEEGHELGMTGWRCIMRYDPPLPAEKELASADQEDESPTPVSTPAPAPTEASSSADKDKPLVSRYAEIFLTADSLHRATDLALEALEELLEAAGIEVDAEQTPEPLMVASDRWNAEDFTKAVQQAADQKPDMNEPAVHHAAWLN